jgi:predicted NBD/HSP70 family sugar kinase/serine phosphatase RsbU (regulator of sigma subunit)/anti-sigma regulatory factor (Ser/Thr protein kinase)
MVTGGDLALLRRFNVQAVLRVLRDSEPLTLSQISRAAAVSREAADIAISELDEQGWIEETPPERGTTRPARRYRFRAEAGYVLGVDIGVNKVRMILADLHGTLIAQRRSELRWTRLNTEERLARVREAVTGFVRDSAVPPGRLRGLCLGHTGIIDATGRILLSDAVPEWNGLDLAHRAGQWFGCPAYAENDCNLAALAEHWRGAAQLSDACICILSGDRTGAGLLLDGHIHRGRGGAAGEIGAMAVLGWDSIDMEELQRAPDVGRVFADAAAGDPAATALVDRFAGRLAVGTAALVLAVNPDLVVISGGVSRAGETLAVPLRRHLQELCLDLPQVAVSPLGVEVVALGAVRLALDHAEAELFGLWDSTELREIASRAEVARERLKLLYDAGVRMGTALDVVRTAQELAEVAVPRFADVVTVELLEPVLHGEEPTGPSVEIRRTAIAGLEGDHPLYPTGKLISFPPATPLTRGMTEGAAILERDLSAAGDWRAVDPERTQKILDYGMHSMISVPLQARGIVLGVANFWRAQTPEAFEQEDVSFSEELAARAAICIDNARRYTHEHATAVTLQRSLLPRGLPQQDALEVAFRYLPAEAGVGGDWFDVIPLPGARIALVVGDVVGHGLHAAATMGRLRMAVHNFSALDLAPDELLTHLDELVARVDHDETSGGDQGITGATCLYAIYDPVPGRVAVARAGHIGPAVVHPDGFVAFPEVPGSPPLGLGGSLPVETAELEVPEDSRLVLFTDGLVEDRHRDIDTGLAQLRQALDDARGQDPEQICRTAFDALRPSSPDDDIALLVARTHLTDPDRVAGWDVPPDPAAVGLVRAQAGHQLTAWGLDDIGFVTELILSELVTNAIRYGAPPIRVRLLYDRTLICEVTDGSSTSPHLRRAATTDEGGRGLFLVAQYAERWGTRYTVDGKVIWTEQSLNAMGEPTTDLADVLLAQWDESVVPHGLE